MGLLPHGDVGLRSPGTRGGRGGLRRGRSLRRARRRGNVRLGLRAPDQLHSSGQITENGRTPYFILIDRALRDEGTSYHYVSASEWSEAPADLVSKLARAFHGGPRVLHGSTWTTDAPFRETEAAIAAARARGILAVEMEAAALYAFARARGRALVCFAQVTNQMGRVDGDFEKGEANGTADALEVLSCSISGVSAPAAPPVSSLSISAPPSAH